MTPTEWFPGEPMTATGIVTSPAWTTAETDELAVAVVGRLDAWLVATTDAGADGGLAATDAAGPDGLGDGSLWQAVTPRANTTRSAADARA